MLSNPIRFVRNQYLHPTFNLKDRFAIGDTFEATQVIDQKQVFNPTKNPSDNVYATSNMINQVEYVCSSHLESKIEPHHGSVGYYVEVDHRKPVLLGETVKIISEIVELTDRKATFKTLVFRNDDLISTGTHKRAIVRFDH